MSSGRTRTDERAEQSRTLKTYRSPAHARQVDAPIPIETTLRICYPKGELQGRVCYCVFREIGYFLGIEFEPGFRWSMRQFLVRSTCWILGNFCSVMRTVSPCSVCGKPTDPLARF